MGYVKKEDLSKKLQEEINSKQSRILEDIDTHVKYKLVVKNKKLFIEVVSI